jgi:hypothetical protein
MANPFVPAFVGILMILLSITNATYGMGDSGISARLNDEAVHTSKVMISIMISLIVGVYSQMLAEQTDFDNRLPPLGQTN